MSSDRPAAAMSSALAAVDRFLRVRLGHAPTPFDPAPQLGAALGIELWIKRDDCTGLTFGGNKVRQLEFHLGEAQARGADTVLVTGAVQSNLVRLAAAGYFRMRAAGCFSSIPADCRPSSPTRTSSAPGSRRRPGRRAGRRVEKRGPGRHHVATYTYGNAIINPCTWRKHRRTRSL